MRCARCPCPCRRPRRRRCRRFSTAAASPRRPPPPRGPAPREYRESSCVLVSRVCDVCVLRRVRPDPHGKKLGVKSSGSYGTGEQHTTSNTRSASPSRAHLCPLVSPGASALSPGPQTASRIAGVSRTRSRSRSAGGDFRWSVARISWSRPDCETGSRSRRTQLSPSEHWTAPQSGRSARPLP